MRGRPTLALTCCGRTLADVTRPLNDKGQPIDSGWTYGGLSVGGHHGGEVDQYRHPVGERRTLPDEPNNYGNDRLPTYTITCPRCTTRHKVRHERLYARWMAGPPPRVVRVSIAEIR